MSILDKDAMIVNGEKLVLTDEEYDAAVTFHKGRRIFLWESIIKDDKHVYQLRINKFGDERDHRQWVKEDFGINDSVFEHCPRGYMMPDRIQIFIGSTHTTVPESILSQLNLYDDFRFLVYNYVHTFGETDVIPVFNGVHVGKIGEQWKPIRLLFYVAGMLPHKLSEEEVVWNAMKRSTCV